MPATAPTPAVMAVFHNKMLGVTLHTEDGEDVRDDTEVLDFEDELDKEFAEFVDENRNEVVVAYQYLNAKHP